MYIETEVTVVVTNEVDTEVEAGICFVMKIVVGIPV